MWHRFFQPMKSDVYLHFLGEIGIVILLFQVGLESNIKQMQSIGMRAFFVAIIGVLAPYLLGRYLAGPYLMPGFSDQTYIFRSYINRNFYWNYSKSL